jgi:hypothetical protein
MKDRKPMAPVDLGETLQALWSGIFSPLVLGGQLMPLRPIGPRRAWVIARASQTLGACEMSWVDTARVRQARRLCPVDSIQSPSRAQWAMAAALNDLLQSTNSALDGMLSRRSPTLLKHVETCLDAIAPPPTVREAVSRHASFARLLEIQRTDTHVTWWCGSSQFRGRQPPARLLKWKRLRRVNTEEANVKLPEMATATSLDATLFLDTLGKLIKLSPLTDLATASRSQPRFQWSESTLALLTSGPGRILAARALRQQDAGQVGAALQRAGLPRDPAWKAAVQSLVEELKAYSQAG